MTVLTIRDVSKFAGVNPAINFYHRLTDLHLSTLIMTVLTFRDVSKFSGVNTAIETYQNGSM